MAAVGKTRVVYAGVDNDHIIRGRATVALEPGDPVVITATVADARFDFTVAKATSGDIDGLALDVAVPNGPVEVCYLGEFDGFSGLTPKAYLSVAAGAIDTTAPAGTKQIKALNPTRILINCF